MRLSFSFLFQIIIRRHVVDKIMKCSYSFSGKRWRRISQQAKLFVSDLLIFDPEDRPTACEALSSVWLNKRFDASIRSVTEDVMDHVQVSLEMFSSYKTVKKLALMVIAHKSTSEEIGFLRKAFSRFDTHNDGTVTFSEFQDCLAEYGYNDEELERMFQGAVSRLIFISFITLPIYCYSHSHYLYPCICNRILMVQVGYHTRSFLQQLLKQLAL